VQAPTLICALAHRAQVMKKLCVCSSVELGALAEALAERLRNLPERFTRFSAGLPFLPFFPFVQLSCHPLPSRMHPSNAIQSKHTAKPTMRTVYLKRVKCGFDGHVAESGWKQPGPILLTNR
jgi:hypothetical protein